MVGTLTSLQIVPGGPELIIILLIVALLFGASRIPKLARSTGEAMGEFQKGREQVEQELNEMREGATGTTTESSPTVTDTAETASDDAASGDQEEPDQDVSIEEAERE